MWVHLFLITSACGLVVGCVEQPGEPPEAGSRCSTDHHRITALHLPRSLAEASLMGFDLDGRVGGDPAVDNQLGALSASLATIYDGWRPDEALTAQLATRQV